MSERFYKDIVPPLKCVIVDLDGTLADVTHRRHYVSQKPKNWKAFYDEMVNDSPRPGLLQLINFLSYHCMVIIFSARPHSYYVQTHDWLKKHKVRNFTLFMRDDGGQKPDVEVKREMLAKLRDTWPSIEILGVFDDRQRVVDFWRSEGLECYQVDKWEEVE